LGLLYTIYASFVNVLLYNIETADCCLTAHAAETLQLTFVSLFSGSLYV